MQRQGWTRLFHECVIGHLRRMNAAAQRAERQDPQAAGHHANFKLFRALSHLIQDGVPSDPDRDEYRQGNTLCPAFRLWRREMIGRRFRLFFRYDVKARVIVSAWVNEFQTRSMPISWILCGQYRC